MKRFLLISLMLLLTSCYTQIGYSSRYFYDTTPEPYVEKTTTTTTTTTTSQSLESAGTSLELVDTSEMLLVDTIGDTVKYKVITRTQTAPVKDTVVVKETQKEVWVWERDPWGWWELRAYDHRSVYWTTYVYYGRYGYYPSNWYYPIWGGYPTYRPYPDYNHNHKPGGGHGGTSGGGSSGGTTKPEVPKYETGAGGGSSVNVKVERPSSGTSTSTGSTPTTRPTNSTNSNTNSNSNSGSTPRQNDNGRFGRGR